LVVVAGSPGAGKSTLCHELQLRWNIVPTIDLGDLRNFHLDSSWTNQSEKELAIAFDHLVYIVHSYAKHAWTPVLVTDLREAWVARVEEFFGDLRYVIVTLFATNDAVAERVTRRDDGFKDVAAAVAWNRSVRRRPLLPNEVRVDSSGPVAQIADHVELILSGRAG